MAKGRFIDRVMAALLGTLAAVGSMGVLASGMRFDAISVTSLALPFLVSSFVVAALAGRKIFPVLPVLLACGCLYLWWSGALEPALEAFLHQISQLYDMGYHWGVIRWTDMPVDQEKASVVFAVLGFWIGLAVTWTTVRGRLAWLSALLTFAPLIPCMILTDTVPGTGFLFVQLLCILLLIMSQRVRKRNVRQGGKLLVLLILPVTLALGVLFLLMPRENYQGQLYAQKLEEYFLQVFQSTPVTDVITNEQNIQTETASRVHLTTVGPKSVRLQPVMTVTAEETALLYLRGTAYDVYRGTSWDEDVVDYRFSFYNHGAAYKKVTITTNNIHDLLFVPYAPQTITSGGDVIAHNIIGRVDNKDNLREYTVTYSPVTDMEALKQPPYIVNGTLIYNGGEYIDMRTGQVATSPAARYLRLPDATLSAAQALLAQDLPELEGMDSQWEQAQAIVDYVRRSASYDLNTKAMPTGEEDFAMWFLQESDTGYCVHFATAATVLLRAADIPARYVTGYMTWTRAGETVTVQQKNAHAWTEIYIGGIGWVSVDATPPAGVNQTAGTEPTEPPTEAPVTEPENPGETAPEDITTPTVTGETTDNPQNTEPSNQDGTEPEQDNTGDGPVDAPFVMPGWLRILLLAAVVVGAAYGQRKIRVLLRKRRYTRGSNNARALALWRDIERYGWLLKKEPEEQLLELAWKARFSQYRLTKEELAEMERGLNTFQKELATSSRWKKMCANWVLALQ